MDTAEAFVQIFDNNHELTSEKSGAEIALRRPLIND
jgi:hypothetical protein